LLDSAWLLTPDESGVAAKALVLVAVLMADGNEPFCADAVVVRACLVWVGDNGSCEEGACFMAGTGNTGGCIHRHCIRCKGAAGGSSGWT
jgi:hypothetical protein